MASASTSSATSAWWSAVAEEEPNEVAGDADAGAEDDATEEAMVSVVASASPGVPGVCTI